MSLEYKSTGAIHTDVENDKYLDMLRQRREIKKGEQNTFFTEL